MVVGAPAPISLSVAQAILSLSMLNYMYEPFDSFQGARTTSASTASYYSWDAGSSTAVAWNHGLGSKVVNGVETQHPEDVTILSGSGGAWIPATQLAQMVALAAGYEN
jgi:hypothetical protein